MEILNLVEVVRGQLEFLRARADRHGITIALGAEPGCHSLRADRGPNADGPQAAESRPPVDRDVG